MDGNNDCRTYRARINHCTILPERLLSVSPLLSMVTLERADADGLLKCPSKSLEPLGVNDVLNKENVIGVSGNLVLVG